MSTCFQLQSILRYKSFRSKRKLEIAEGKINNLLSEEIRSGILKETSRFYLGFYPLAKLIMLNVSIFLDAYILLFCTKIEHF